MSLDSVKDLLSGFEWLPSLPDPGSLVGSALTIARVLVMAGPVVMVIMGLLYLFAAPAEANHHFGYRCYFGMGSVQAWQFTQRLAGAVWLIMGVCLGLAMVLIKQLIMPQLEIMDMLLCAVGCLLAQVGALLLATIFIRTIVACTFDRHGVRRREKREKTKTT